MKEILLPTLICNAFYSMAIPPGDPRRETFATGFLSGGGLTNFWFMV